MTVPHISKAIPHTFAMREKVLVRGRELYVIGWRPWEKRDSVKFGAYYELSGNPNSTKVEHVEHASQLAKIREPEHV